jgi:selenium metabolism protein YedF
MNKNIDLRGLVCPEPVLRTKKLLDDSTVEKVEALVESEINVNNLTRLARSLKLKISAQPQEDHFKVTIERRGDTEAEAKSEHAAQHASSAALNKSISTAANEVGTVVFLSKDKFGDGDQDFSVNLMNVFLQTMLDAGHMPRAILMANTAVRLIDSDASTHKVLQDFKARGCEVLACGLCVEFYGLKGKVPPEQITNMFAICEFLMAADKVITP